MAMTPRASRRTAINLPEGDWHGRPRDRGDTVTRTEPEKPYRWWEWLAPPLLVAALMYVMGLSFAKAYYREFGVGLLSLNIPNQYFFVYGFQVLRAYAWVVMPIYAAAIPAGWWLRRRSSAAGAVMLAAAPLLILLLFVASHCLGERNGARVFRLEAGADFPSLPQSGSGFEPTPTGTSQRAGTPCQWRMT